MRIYFQLHVNGNAMPSVSVGACVVR